MDNNFEKWAESPQGSYINAKLAWKAAKSESEKEIAELKATVKKWQENSVDLEYKCLDKNLRTAELTASNNRLREALIDTNSRFNEMVDVFYKGSTAGDRKRIEANFELLSSTPAQSLAEHDDEVIERCAKVCESLKEQDYCVDVRAGAEAIRELKGK